MRILTFTVCLAAAMLLFPATVSLSAAAEDSMTETAAAAVRTMLAWLTAEDRFVIVYGQEELALSPFMQELRFPDCPAAATVHLPAETGIHL